MLEFLAKALPIFLTALTVPIIISWLNRGTGNRRKYILGSLPIFFALALVGFDLVRKRYSENDYTTRQIVVRKCLLNKASDGIIVADDGLEYPFDRSLLWRVGSAPELAELLCHQRKLKLWLNPENEISAFEGEDFSIPIEVGITRDNSRQDFLPLAVGILILCPIVLIIGFWYNKKKEKG